MFFIFILYLWSSHPSSSIIKIEWTQNRMPKIKYWTQMYGFLNTQNWYLCILNDRNLCFLCCETLIYVICFGTQNYHILLCRNLRLGSKTQNTHISVFRNQANRFLWVFEPKNLIFMISRCKNLKIWFRNAEIWDFLVSKNNLCLSWGRTWRWWRTWTRIQR